MQMRHRLLNAATLALALGAAAPLTALGHPAGAPATEHVEWSRSANIYEVNIRQYTEQGTFKAFASHLPRLKEMGVDILWIMPIQPIGERERKGTLGSYYAVRDYTGINPEFGTLDDFKSLVAQAHGLGMRVILDWVANHTAWDHPWVEQHSDWYKKDAQGKIYPVTFNPGPDVEYWTDVIALDYTRPALWKGMTEAMAYWVRETGIDGFRCDVASLVPTAFWNQARRELDQIKPMFMLAESDVPELHEQAFDMSYGWDLQAVLKQVAKGQADAGALAEYVQKAPQNYPQHAYRMRFTSNHDINSWHGTDQELYGPAFQAMAVLAATLPGMPLLYGGQESGLDKRLAFFEKDQVDWKDYPYAEFYRTLLQLKKDNPAMWNGQYGAKAEVLATGNPKVFAFRRAQEGNAVHVVVNVSASEQRFALSGGASETLAPWRWRIITP